MNIGPMTTHEALAVARLRQWAFDRTTLKSAGRTDYQREGWSNRHSSMYDARIVRVIDFERALDRLKNDERIALVLTYRDKEFIPQIARAIGCSERKVTYLVPSARQHLARLLDELNLL